MNERTLSDPVVQLRQTARALVAKGKGILAADESTGTIQKRFQAAGIDCTETSRRDYRELLFRAQGAGQYISGVILFDETLRQKAADGTPLVRLLESQGIIPGIKVDQGTEPLAFHPDETVTRGLDGLRARLQEYRRLGARFTKWRGVYRIGEGTPSGPAVTANAHALARYAALAQEADLVPIVEPEVLMDGEHDAGTCEFITEEVLRAVFSELVVAEVDLEAMLLKPNMVLSGQDAAEPADPEEVADRTLACFRRVVPAAVPGIVFLSGGQSDEDATQHLNLINRRGPQPWPLTFSYGRGLQAAPLRAWAGRRENAARAQAAFLERARANGLASQGRYSAQTSR